MQRSEARIGISPKPSHSSGTLSPKPGAGLHHRPEEASPTILPAGENSDFNGLAQVADCFVLAPGRHALTQVRWWGTYRGGALPLSDDFTLRVFESEGSTPATIPVLEFHAGHVERDETGIKTPALSLDLYEYRATIPHTELAADTGRNLFWLSVVNGTATGDWGWIGYATRGNAQFRRGDASATWIGLAGSVAFWLAT